MAAKVALVTGGNKGIGLELCRKLPARGETFCWVRATPIEGRRPFASFSKPIPD